jgi:NAD(P)-dependent dehydrogenase (short-subunit alcohol dehydrogenase family)
VVRDSKKAMAVGRGAEPEEIVGTVIYLESDASSLAVAANVKVDGGLTRTSRRLNRYVRSLSELVS